MEGIIERITVYPAKGEAGRDLVEGRLIENLGLEGDFHAKGGERQVSLLFTENREQLATQKEKGLCFSCFRANINIRGFAPDTLTPGVRFAAGEAILEISGVVKRCHAECALYEAGKLCALAGLNLFARVVKSGVIRVGERVDTVTSP